MEINAKITIIITSFIYLFIVMILIRKRKMNEEYSLIWITSGISIVVISIYTEPLFFLTRLLGGKMPASIVFFFGILFLMFLNMTFSVRLSSMKDQLKELIQTNGLLENRIRELEKRNKK